MTKLKYEQTQQHLTESHAAITAALAFVATTTAATEPGKARQSLAELQTLLEQVYALTLSAKRRLRHWNSLFGEASSTMQDQMVSLSEVFPDDVRAESESAADEEAEEDMDEDGEAGEEADDDDDVPDAYDFFMENDEDPEPDAKNKAAELDTLWGYVDFLPTTWRPSGQPIHPAIIGDDVFALLFGISEADAAAGVDETGYLNIFGDWVPGRPPRPYIRPADSAADHAGDNLGDEPDSTADRDEPEEE